jgi:hypothetical protein
MHVVAALDRSTNVAEGGKAVAVKAICQFQCNALFKSAK